MNGVGFSLRGHKSGSLAVGNKVKRTGFDVGEPFFVEQHRPLAGMVQSLGRYGVAFGKSQDPLDPP